MENGAPVKDLVRVQLGTSWFLIQEIGDVTKVTAPAICPCATCVTIRMGGSVTPDSWVKQHIAMDEGKQVARAILASGEFVLPVEVVRAVGDPPEGMRIFEEEGGAGWETESEEGVKELTFEEFKKTQQASKKKRKHADEAEKESGSSKAPKSKKAKIPAPRKEATPRQTVAESSQEPTPSQAPIFKKPKLPAPKKAAPKQPAAKPKPPSKGKGGASRLPLYVPPTPPLPTPGNSGTTTPQSSDSEDGRPQPPTAEELEALDEEYEARMKVFRESEGEWHRAERERIKAQHESYAERGFPEAERLVVPDRRRSI